MKKFFQTFFILLAFLALPFCSGTNQGGSEVGNPEPVSLSVIAYSSSDLKQFKALSLQSGDLNIDRAEIVLGRIQLSPLRVCQEESISQEEIRFEGPFIVDLLGENPLSELKGLDIPSDTYCRIELRLEKLASNIEGGSSIFGNSVFIEGARSDGVPFQVKFEADEELKLENETSGFQILPALGLDKFFVAFDLDLWFSGVNLFDSGIEISTDGNGDPIIFIDNNHNTEIREIIIDNLELSSDLFEDQDDDGELDSDEQDDSLAEGKVLP